MLKTIRDLLFWREAIHVETFRELHFNPQADITAFEVAQCVPVFSLTGKERSETANDIWECVPINCQRHFSMLEKRYMVQGLKRKFVAQNLCFQMMKYDPLEPNSKVWEACSRPSMYGIKLGGYDYTKDFSAEKAREREARNAT